MLSARKFFIFAFLLLATSCSVKPHESVYIPAASKTISPKLLGVVTTHWDLGKNLELTSNGFSLTVYGVVLTGDKTTVFITLTGINLQDLTSIQTIQLIDNNNLVSPLIYAIPIMQQEELIFGLLVFEARRSGANFINFQLAMKSNPADVAGFLLASLNGSQSEDSINSTYTIAQEVPIDQNKYRISLVWSLPPGVQIEKVSDPAKTPNNSSDTKPLPTPTVIPTVELMPLAPGIFVQSNASFRIEDIDSGEIHYIGVQLLSNGNAVVLINDKAEQSVPVFVVTSTPTPEPYPSSSEASPAPLVPQETYPE
jgi:hypothetical protein